MNKHNSLFNKKRLFWYHAQPMDRLAPDTYMYGPYLFIKRLSRGKFEALSHGRIRQVKATTLLEVVRLYTGGTLYA